MVNAVGSYSTSGLRDWLLQRVTAVVLGAYSLFVIGFLLCHPQMGFTTWQQLFSHTTMRIATLLALLSILVHAWIGLWIVSTDYIKVTILRLSTQVAIVLLLLGFLVWGVEILWT